MQTFSLLLGCWCSRDTAGSSPCCHCTNGVILLDCTVTTNACFTVGSSARAADSKSASTAFLVLTHQSPNADIFLAPRLLVQPRYRWQQPLLPLHQWCYPSGLHRHHQRVFHRRFERKGGRFQIRLNRVPSLDPPITKCRHFPCS